MTISSVNHDNHNVIYLIKSLTAKTVLENLLKAYSVQMTDTHKSIFLRRSYRREQLERAIKRYKVFKDLGFEAK